MPRQNERSQNKGGRSNFSSIVRGPRAWRPAGRAGIFPLDRAEHGCAADALQPALLRRSGFQARLTPGVRRRISTSQVITNMLFLLHGMEH
jgi:hypothetical protein